MAENRYNGLSENDRFAKWKEDFHAVFERACGILESEKYIHWLTESIDDPSQSYLEIKDLIWILIQASHSLGMLFRRMTDHSSSDAQSLKNILHDIRSNIQIIQPNRCFPDISDSVEQTNRFTDLWGTSEEDRIRKIQALIDRMPKHQHPVYEKITKIVAHALGENVDNVNTSINDLLLASNEVVDIVTDLGYMFSFNYPDPSLFTGKQDGEENIFFHK